MGSFGGGLFSGFGTGAAKAATGSGTDNSQTPDMASGALQAAPVPQSTDSSSHWSILPILQHTLGMGGGGQQGGGGMSILPMLQRVLGMGGQQQQVPAAPQKPVTQQPLQSTAPAAATATPIAPGTARPLNTQQQYSGFQGLIPMIQNHVANQHAATRDSSAQEHISALQGGNLTPEQHQYHISNLQQIYSGQPQVLQQMGIAVPGAYSVPQVQAPAGR